jgi:hypothetical protein
MPVKPRCLGGYFVSILHQKSHAKVAARVKLGFIKLRRYLRVNKHIIMQIVMGIAVLSFLSLLFPQNAYAYIDPGSASYVVQIIVAAFIAIMFYFRGYWHRIKEFFVKPKDKEKDETER